MTDPFEISREVKSLNERLQQIQESRNQIVNELIAKSDKKEEIKTLSKEKEQVKERINYLVDRWPGEYKKWLKEQKENDGRG